MKGERPTKDVHITITISEVNGKLDVTAQIPDGVERSIACQLAKTIMNMSNALLNQVLGENTAIKIERVQ